MIRNIDLYVQIPGLSRTSKKMPGLSRPGIKNFKFQDFPGFQGPVRTLSLYKAELFNQVCHYHPQLLYVYISNLKSELKG